MFTQHLAPLYRREQGLEQTHPRSCRQSVGSLGLHRNVTLGRSFSFSNPCSCSAPQGAAKPSETVKCLRHSAQRQDVLSVPARRPQDARPPETTGPEDRGSHSVTSAWGAAGALLAGGCRLFFRTDREGWGCCMGPWGVRRASEPPTPATLLRLSVLQN